MRMPKDTYALKWYLIIKEGNKGSSTLWILQMVKMIISTHVEAFLAHLQQECVHAHLLHGCCLQAQASD